MMAQAELPSRPPLPLSDVRIQGWIFELNNVLYDATAWRRWLLQLLSKMGLYTHYDVFFRVWDHEFARDVHTGHRSFRDAIEALLISTGMPAAKIQEVIPALRAQHKKLSADQRAIPGVVETLRALSIAGTRLGVSADTELKGDEVRLQLRTLGLGHLLDAVVTSSDLGRAKPDPEAYTSVLSSMDLPLSAVVFVGHDPDHISGAHQLGLRTVALDCPPMIEATWHIERVSELLEIGPVAETLRRAGKRAASTTNAVVGHDMGLL